MYEDHTHTQLTSLAGQGSTRRKLATASGCIIEYVGRLACMCGTTSERIRARDYIDWLLAQRLGPVHVDILDREDVTCVEIPKDSVGFITGYRGESLRRIEEQSGSFLFTNGSDGKVRGTTA